MGLILCRKGVQLIRARKGKASGLQHRARIATWRSAVIFLRGKGMHFLNRFVAKKWTLLWRILIILLLPWIASYSSDFSCTNVLDRFVVFIDWWFFFICLLLFWCSVFFLIYIIFLELYTCEPVFHICREKQTTDYCVCFDSWDSFSFSFVEKSKQHIIVVVVDVG